MRIFLAKMFWETKMSMEMKAKAPPLKKRESEMFKLSFLVQQSMTPVTKGIKVRYVFKENFFLKTTL